MEGIIRALTELIKTLAGIFRGTGEPGEPDEHADGLEEEGFVKLQKEHPDDPTMAVRIHRKK